MICYKRILFFLLFFVFLFCSCSFCAETNTNPTSGGGGTIGQQNDNEFQTLMDIQTAEQHRFILELYALKNSDNNCKTLVTRIFNQFSGLGANGKFIYIKENFSGYSKRFDVYMAYLADMKKSCQTAYIYGNQAFPNTTMLSGTFYLIGGVGENGCFSYSDYSHTASLTVPFAFACSLSSEFVDLFKDFGLINNEQLAQILTALINCQNSLIVLRNQNTNLGNFVKNEGTQTREEIKNSTDKINDNINNNDTSEIDTSGITNSDTTVDITQDGFNSIFTTLQTYFTSNNGGSLTLNIPFVNKSITISKATVYGHFKQLSTVENLASVVWYFVISLYIVKQVQKMINKIKSGNLEDVVDNNIKADIL